MYAGRHLLGVRRRATPPQHGKVFHRQGYHLLGWVGIGAALWLATLQFPERRDVVWGHSASEWIAASWVLAGLHQGWIAFFWRAELHGGRIRAWLGDAGFPVFKAGFFVLGPARLLMVVPISLATANTLPLPRSVALALIVVTTPFILWTFHSFVFHFGIDRAVGADHFDPSYRGAPLEKRGIFRYLRNPAYAVALLILYHAGLLWMSGLGLVAAAAHHAFVWVAYFCTEKPDMEVIYGGRGGSSARSLG